MPPSCAKKTVFLTKPMLENVGDALCKIAPAVSSLPVLPGASVTTSLNER
jgi:hypothetical protein